MEPKKNEKYDLEGKSPLFFSIGLIVALLCVTAAFEWRMEYDPVVLHPGKDIIDEPFEAVITKIPEPEPPKPKKPKDPEPEKQPTPLVNIIEATDDIPKELIDDVIVPDDFEPVSIDPIIDDEPDVYEGVVETMPTFPGGEEAFYEYINKNIRYTRQAKALQISGRVFVRFVIDETGKITEVEAIKGPGAGLDEEAVRVLENAPKWNPGKQRGRPVKFRMVIPITFSLAY